jgi:hypothetical protein
MDRQTPFDPIIRFAKREIAGIPLFCWILLAVYLGSLFFIAFIGFYVVPDMLLLLSFILLLPFIRKIASSPLFDTLRSAELREKLVVLFILSLLLRGVLLFNDEVITNDISLYVERSSAMVDDGDLPYVEKEMHKPPMYAYMLYFLGQGLGPGEMQFRAFFSVVDSVMAVAVFFLLRKKFDEAYALYGGLVYSICPINVISTGLEGHYDPLVSFFVIAALWLHFEGRNHLSSLSLGVGFAFKLFPFIFAPFLVWKLKEWKERILYTVLFFVPMVASWIPLILIDPDTFRIYREYQTGQWLSEAMKSFSKAYELIALDQGWYSGNPTDPATFQMNILGFTHTDFFLYVFLGITGLMFLHWVWARWQKEDIEEWLTEWDNLGRFMPEKLRKRLEQWNIPGRFIPKNIRTRLLQSLDEPSADRMGRVFLIWYKVILITFVIYYGTQIATGFLLYEVDFRDSLGIENPWMAVGIAAFVYYGLAAFVLHRWRGFFFPKKMAVPEKEELFVLGTFAMMFLLFGSPDYPTWYIMWFIPLLLGIKTERIRFMLFAVGIWNIPGEGINLWPGKEIATETYRWE